MRKHRNWPSDARLWDSLEMPNPTHDSVLDAVLDSWDLNYSHPILMLQLLLWHEGYHHGQIKLALKLSGLPISDDDAGPATWDVWRRRN